MFISDTDKKRYIKTIWVYTALSVLCIVINKIYANFSHGVSSDYMTLMFLYPLLGGAILFLIFRMLKLPCMSRLPYNLFNSGIVTLTTGSLLHGVFEIAGTSSSLQSVFTITGIAFIFTGMVIHIFILIKQSKTNPS